MSPEADVAGAREATGRLLAHLEDLPPASLPAPSLLPGWSRAHVVAHLAGNARSHVRMLDGCLAGEVRDQYEGGDAAREAAVDGLARRPAEAVAEHREACAALDRRWAAMRPEHWRRPVRRLDRAPEPADGLGWARWREVEVHRVDLAVGYGPADWPEPFVRRLLAELVRRPDLPPLALVADGQVVRAGPGPRVAGAAAALAAWLAGRSPGDGLDTAGGALPVLPPWR